MTGGTNPGRYYILSDHLGSTSKPHGSEMPDVGRRPTRATSVVTNASGTVVSTTGYYPFGETRYTTGSLYTDKLYTGYRSLTAPKCPIPAQKTCPNQVR